MDLKRRTLAKKGWVVHDALEAVVRALVARGGEGAERGALAPWHGRFS
ncbi:hypothetical protein [Thermus thermophilus]|uniref:Uncharacterized protein n=1 Tax=Thermus thermophilus TaxID=274 RepID=A0A7R7TGB2_THETH|nr:hypothetical protein [Thermus thermophilus]BCP67606.1 hypothetical protein TthHB5018_c25400 [Thermus thermophilus]